MTPATVRPQAQPVQWNKTQNQQPLSSAVYIRCKVCGNYRAGSMNYDGDRQQRAESFATELTEDMELVLTIIDGSTAW